MFSGITCQIAPGFVQRKKKKTQIESPTGANHTENDKLSVKNIFPQRNYYYT